MARRVAVELTPQTIDQIAVRVAQLLRHQQSTQTNAENVGWLTVSQLARHLNLNRTWIYEHADELGAIRVGKGPKARIRFDLHTATAALRQNQATRAPLQTSKPRRPRPIPDPHQMQAPLLEIRPREIRSVRGCMSVRRGTMRHV
jgi:hypothetical protein